MSLHLSSLDAKRQKLNARRRKLYWENHEQRLVSRRNYVAKNKERVYASGKVWRERNPERVKEYSANYRRENLDKLHERRRIQYWKDPKQRREYSREYYKNHKEQRSKNYFFLRERALNRLRVGSVVKCYSCGCPRKELLQFNHLHPHWKEGERPVSEATTYLIYTILRHKNPKKEFNILCSVCNWAYHHTQKSNAHWRIQWIEPKREHPSRKNR